jgi:hypothetical protein
MTALLRVLLTGKAREEITRENILKEYNSAMVFASKGPEIISPPGNGAYCFRIRVK